MSGKQEFYQSLQVPTAFVKSGGPSVGMTIGHGISRLISDIEGSDLDPDLSTLKVTVLPWALPDETPVYKIIATMEGTSTR